MVKDKRSPSIYCALVHFFNKSNSVELYLANDKASFDILIQRFNRCHCEVIYGGLIDLFKGYFF